jgi:hypothetical protein
MCGNQALRQFSVPCANFKDFLHPEAADELRKLIMVAVPYLAYSP